MRKCLVVLAVSGAISGSAVAQSTAQPGVSAAPPAPSSAVPAPVVIPTGPAASASSTVKKVVCERVHDDATVGSRIGASRKVCRTIMVPAGSGGGKANRSTPTSERG